MLIKANLHFHTKDDHADGIEYTFYQGIDCAASLGFEVIALTCHRKFVYPKEYIDYAASKNILLISGIELSLEENRHVLALNCDKDINEVKSFSDLANYKKSKPEVFIMAPHPFLCIGSYSLGKKLEKHIDLFDAIELTWFYSKWFDRNVVAEQVAKKYDLPFIATSDTHILEFLDKNYAVIDAKEKSAKAIFEAIKQKKFRNITSPRSFLKELAWKQGKFMAKGILSLIKQKCIGPGVF